MASAGRRRRGWIVIGWLIVLVGVVWATIPLPPHDEEYAKWFVFGSIIFVVPWLVNFLLLLGALLWLEKRVGRARMWILGAWVFLLVPFLVMAMRAGFMVEPTSWQKSVRLGLQGFAYPWLFGLLLVLLIALWVENRLWKTRNRFRVTP